MPKTPTAPAPAPVETEEKLAKWLRPYVAHGVSINSEVGMEAIGDCPFCGREDKFYIALETGMWQCKVCQTGTRKGGGNIYTFIRQLHEMGRCLGPDAIKLAKARKLLSAKTLEAWGLVISPTTGEWVIPAYDAEGKITNLYRYAKVKHEVKGWTHTLLPTPELHVGLIGMNLFDKSKEDIHLHESWGNALAHWEVMRQVKYHMNPDGTTATLAPTANEKLSLAADANVLAMTSAWVFQESWLSLFEKKNVYLWFDSDYPKLVNNKEQGLAGFRGMRRTAELLTRPGGAASVQYVCWGPDGYDPARRNGWDVRDHLSQDADIRGRCGKLTELMAKLQPMPAEWVGTTAKTAGSTEIDPEDCREWPALADQWNIAITMTPKHKYALATMLAVAISTRLPGAQLWLMVLSPPSTGKTTLVDGLGVSRKYTYSMAKFTGFYSGYDDGSGEDHSPVVNMFDKTVIIKEGSNLISSSNRESLVADFTATYDRTLKSVFKDKKRVRDYAGNMTVLICGTGLMRQMEAAETGARFLVCSIMDEIPEELEDNILERASFGAIRNVALETNCSVESQFDPDRLLAMKMTGGYLNYLRDNSNEILGTISIPDKYRVQCCRYAKFVSYMRARPSKVQDEATDRELGARLVEQFIKLAMGYAAVTGKREVDAEIMEWVHQIALDSSFGKTFNIAEILIEKGGEKGLIPKTLNQFLHSDEKSVAPYRQYLCKIGVCELVYEKVHQYSSNTTERIRITPKVRKLYESVMEKH